MSFSNAPNVHPLPGYRLLSLMGEGGYGEVWKCEAPGGLLKAIKFVPASSHPLDHAGDPMAQERAALGRLRAIRHPFLLSVERIEVVPSGLLVVMELADENLHDVFEAYRAANEPGIPRDVLLDYFAEIAEALDLLNWQHNLLHLDVKPDNIFLVADHAKLGDFGLVTSLPEEGTAKFTRKGGLTPAYAAPEVWSGNVSRHSDQYSLALTWHQLRTGVAVFDGTNARQLMLQHATQPPDLGLLPPQESLVVARALSKNPHARFDCCKSFVHALTTGQAPTTLHPAHRTRRSSATLQRLGSSPVSTPRGSLDQQLAELLGQNNRTTPSAGTEKSRSSAEIERHYISPQLRGVIRLHLEAFKQFWKTKATHEATDRVIYRIELPAGFRLRYPLSSGTLEVDITLELPRVSTGALTELAVRIRAVEGDGVAEKQMVHEVGPLLLESLQHTLDLAENRRGSDRVEWDEALVAWPVWPSENRIGSPILCRGRDISRQGMRLLCPVEPTSSFLRVQFSARTGQAVIDTLARVLRVTPHQEGFEIGVQFCPEAPENLGPTEMPPSSTVSGAR